MSDAFRVLIKSNLSFPIGVKQNLTGGPNGGAFVTDVTNASRTLLMNIETLFWDPMLIKTFNLHVDMLPEIRSSSEIYGSIKYGGRLDGIPVSAILGNQQASLLGQRCIREGQAKNTYRKGCFLLYNTGTRVSGFLCYSREVLLMS